MSSPYPILDNRPIDQWKVTELKEELKRRKLTTKGLKEDLVKRLDEALQAELDAKENATNGSDNVSQPEVQSEQYKQGAIAAGIASDVLDVSKPNIVVEEGRTEPCVPREVETDMDNSGDTKGETTMDNGGDPVEKLDIDLPKDIDGSKGAENEGNVVVGEVLNTCDSGPAEEMLVGQVPVKEPAVEGGRNDESLVSLNGRDSQPSETCNESGDVKSQLETDDSSKVQVGDDGPKSPDAADADLRSVHANASINSSGPNNQVSEVCPALGFQVLSDSISTDSVSINEKNELKDNIIADDVKLEVEVKPEMMQLSSSPVVPDGGKSHSIDVREPHENKPSVEGTSGNNTENIDVVKKNDSGEMGSPGKLNLDRSSGDESMEEDLLESKQIESKPNSDGVKVDKTEASTGEEEDSLVDVVGDDVPADTKVANMEIEKGPAAISVKRKLNDQSGVGSNDVIKRQRRWNSEALKPPEDQSVNVVAATTPKDILHPASKRSLSRSDSTASEAATKERVVPPSSKPPTNSLRIDRFLRPFTLKAVQDLLAKTGTVTNFWMDHIKTHCYVSYSSVEETIKTRNAVYNLQWPPNGGRQLIAEFVDPQELKARVEAPQQSPSTPVTPSFAPAQSTRQPQPSSQQQVQRQQFPPPPPPPPKLSNPPTAREQPSQTREHLPQARERHLPPPPPVAEKAAPPIVTLDDLFRKTKATPRIYYIPLTDEQVAAKLEAQGNNIKQ